MRPLAPDLIAVDSYTSFDQDTPWLYANAEYPQAVMDSFIRAWLRDLQPSAEAYPLFRETVRNLDTVCRRARGRPPPHLRVRGMNRRRCGGRDVHSGTRNEPRTGVDGPGTDPLRRDGKRNVADAAVSLFRSRRPIPGQATADPVRAAGA
jgi:hypothetical protein